VVAALASRPAVGQDQQSASPEAGPFRVLTIKHLVLHDGARHRDVPLVIYYPDAKGPFPVILFSHGALSSKDDYSGLGRYWASFGYVSIHPSHADSVADSGFHGGLKDAIGDPCAWENRPKDLSLVLDALPGVARLAPPLSGKLDLRHIGAAGHSFGAYTAALIGGATIHLPGKPEPRRFADGRVSALVLLSPQGEGRLGLTADSWDDLRLPMLLMYGSLDFGPYGEPPAWRSEAFKRAPPGDKYGVELAGATHMRFAGKLAAPADPSDPVFRCVELETLTFWNAYLKRDGQARDRLASQWPAGCGPKPGHLAAK
jgi:dienelactone hydrolase